MKERNIQIYNKTDFNGIREYYTSKDITLAPAIDLQGEFIEMVKTEPDKYLIDITNWVESLLVHKEKIHDMEGLVRSFPMELVFICIDEDKDLVLDIFKYTFVSFSYIEFEPTAIDLSQGKLQTIPKTDKKTIVNLSNQELDDVLSLLNKNLVGHKKFKEEIAIRLQSFRLFNKLEEQKVFSIFLMGESGIGKTEVGRILHKAFGANGSLCKISFGNYSSKDSLNSLIGSPRGYMGSETGELPMKLERTDIGLVLIDEFEKADNPVYNFFLDLLEEGKFTDSQSKVYDLNGYIIIFTSNLTPENYKKRLSPELRSRFDYVCQFQLLSDEDKKCYMYKKIETTIIKFEEKIGKKITKEDKTLLYSIDYSSLNNLRKINRAIKERFAKIASSYLN